MKTIHNIITKFSCKYGAPMGRCNKGNIPLGGAKVYDCAIPINNGGYDSGGAYWGLGSQLRVSYTKDLSYINFYRKN